MLSAKTVLAAAGTVILLAGTLPVKAVELAVLDHHEKVKARLKGCTAQFGYNPKKQGNLASYQLAPKEREWRECAYRSVHELIMPHTNFPEAYLRLIAEDRLMTELVGERRMTRTERRQRLNGLIEKLKAQELRHVKAAPPTDAEKAELTRQREIELVRRIIFEFRSSLAP
jgi:hypothetical protein